MRTVNRPVSSHGPRGRVFALGLSCALAVAAGLVGGCTVGPNFQPPRPDLPTTWKDPSAHVADGSLTLTANADPRWWRSFHDATLDALIARAAGSNLGLQQMVYRIVETREEEIAARAAGLPSLDASSGATREKLGEAGLLSVLGANGTSGFSSGIGGLTQATNLYQVGFDASWELDLFGRVRRSVEQARAQSQEQIESRNDSLVSLEAEVARTYLQLRSEQALAQVTEETEEAQEKELRLTRLRKQHGLASQQDVDQALDRLTQTRSQLPQHRQLAEQAINDLSVLVGERPGALDAELTVVRPLPQVPPQIAIGLPATLARRRPDIRRAEANLHAATANIGIAVAQLYPDISLSGEAGQRALTVKGLTDWANSFYQFGPSVSLPLFQGGQLRANVRLAKAQQAEAALGYRQAVLSALQDVEDDLVSLRNDRAAQARYEEAVQTESEQVTLAQIRYRNGLGDLFDVLDAKSSLMQGRQDDIRGRLQVVLDVVSLYKALGGGWQIDVPAPAVDPNGASP